MTIDTPLADKTLEAECTDITMEHLVPNSAGLLHAINALHEFHNPVFFSRRLETGRLFHETRFRFGEDAVKKGGFDVNMLDIPVKHRSNVKKSTE